jgi:prophage regulatory protein
MPVAQGHESGVRRVIGREELLHKLPVSRTTLWRLQQSKGFPQPVRLSSNRIGWFEHEVDSWLASRPRGIAVDSRDESGVEGTHED